MSQPPPQNRIQRQNQPNVQQTQFQPAGNRPAQQQLRSGSPLKTLLSHTTPRMAGVAPPDNAELQLEQAPRVKCLNDEAWVSLTLVFYNHEKLIIGHTNTSD